MALTRPERLVLWLANVLPNRLLVEPERLMLAAGWVLIGVDLAVLGAPTSGLADAPALLRVEVGCAFIAGGVTTYAGLWWVKPWLERLGAALLILGCAAFIFAVGTYVGTPAIPVAVLYVAIALTYGLRLLGAAAHRLRLQQAVDGETP